ncbi:MAG TPA: hypothetical protein DCS93_27500 [Microscillaceae bacterium]|nr:hypothetical protein [Microscillaceae bacterium]
MQENAKSQDTSQGQESLQSQKQESSSYDSPYKTREGRLKPVQSKQGQKGTVQRKHKLPKGSSRFTEIATAMGEQHGVDTSPLEATHNSSFPDKLSAEATIQGSKIDFAPGKDTEHNMKHEIGHYIVNTKRGTPPVADSKVNGQAVNTTDEKAADKLADTPLQMKSSNPTFSNEGGLSDFVIQRKIAELSGQSNHVAQLQALDVDTNAAVNTNNSAAPVYQLSAKYNAAKKKADQDKGLSQQEIEEATTEVILELLDDIDYLDSGGNNIKDRVGQGVMYLFDSDYGAVEGMVLLPSIAEVTSDIKKGVFRMALSHELSHYIRTVGNQSEQASFPQVEEVINDIDWDAELKKHPNGNKANWKEEVRADLKGMQIEYSATGKLPTKSDLAKFQAMLGHAVDNAHPPAALRISAMQTYKNEITSGSSCCYLTTACVQTKGLQDNCEELMALRYFRDNYLLNHPQGVELFDLYYDYAPMIVKAIDESEEKDIIYEYIYLVVQSCVNAIKKGELYNVFEKYCEMVVKLKEHFIPEEEIPYELLQV